MKASVICSPGLDGFLGYFYQGSSPTDRAMIVLIGDDGDDLMDQACARWLTKYQNCGALCLALRESRNADPGISLFDLDRVLSGVQFLKKRGIGKIGICGMSMQAVIALSAAARIPEISLVLAFSPCDYVPWGFCHGTVGKSKNAEYPTGESLLQWQGQPLAYKSPCLKKEAYHALFASDSRAHLELQSLGIFDHSEEAEPVPEEAFIPAENIRGAVILVGAEDDSMWNSTRYIFRLRNRLKEKEFMFPVKVFSYTHGTHLLVPQRMLMEALPIIGGLTAWIFAGGRRHPIRCRKARISLDRKLSSYLQSW